MFIWIERSRSVFSQVTLNLVLIEPRLLFSCQRFRQTEAHEFARRVLVGSLRAMATGHRLGRSQALGLVETYLTAARARWKAKDFESEPQDSGATARLQSPLSFLFLLLFFQ